MDRVQKFAFLLVVCLLAEETGATGSLRKADTITRHHRSKYISAVEKTIIARSLMECAAACLHRSTCFIANYLSVGDSHICELLNASIVDERLLETHNDWITIHSGL